MAETDLTHAEQMRLRMLEPDYQQNTHANHAQALREVRALAEQAWPEPTPPPAEETVAAPTETPTPIVSGPMVLTGRAARAFQAARLQAAWRQYLADPANASPELKTAVRPFLVRLKWWR